MPKRLPASIVIDLNPTAIVGPSALLQGQCDVAKFSPATRVEQPRFGGYDCINLDRVDIRAYCGGGGSSHGGFAARPIVPVENCKKSDFSLRTFLRIYDYRSRGLSLVAVLHSSVSAMSNDQSTPYGMGGVVRVRFQGAGIVVPSALEQWR